MLSCVWHCSKYWTWIISSNSHSNPVKCSIMISILEVRKLSLSRKTEGNARHCFWAFWLNFVTALPSWWWPEQHSEEWVSSSGPGLSYHSGHSQLLDTAMHSWSVCLYTVSTSIQNWASCPREFMDKQGPWSGEQKHWGLRQRQDWIGVDFAVGHSLTLDVCGLAKNLIHWGGDWRLHWSA